MQIRVGLENNIEGRTLAWALDYPGCFAYGLDEPEALIRLPRALLSYEIWIKDHTQKPWINFDDLDLRVVERYETFRIDENYRPAPEGQGYEINAWFIDDWRPLTSEEIEQGLKIFHWQREELLAGLSTLDPKILEKDRPGQRWNIWGIVKHIANAELWYLSRLDLTTLNYTHLNPEPKDRLNQTAALIDEVFPSFVDIVKVTGIEGEFWSYRKILRRTLWHQRDHIEHIKELAFERA
ncbi:MAG: DinB family protein [Brevefilum sp.]